MHRMDVQVIHRGSAFASMFQPSPVKSSSLLAENDDVHDDDTDEKDGRAAAGERSSPLSSSQLYVLSNCPHPALDGLLLNAKPILCADGSIKQQNDESHHGKVEEAPPSARPYYAADSEFVHSSPTSRRIDIKSKVKIEQAEDELGEDDHDENESRNANYSDDDNDDDDDASTTELIPTLETYIPREPSYDKANAIPFAQVCKRLESLWNLRFTTAKRKVVLSKQQKLECLLPHALKTYLDGGSPFPYLRLILPEHDSSRAHTGMKEARIAEVYAKAMGCDKGSVVYKQLTGFRSAHVIKNPNSVGDLSCVIADVMKERGMPSNGSKLTVGEINEWLDVLVAAVKNRVAEVAAAGMTASSTSPSSSTAAESDRSGGKSSWRKALEKAVLTAKETTKKYDKYAILVEKLINKNLSVSN
jgi:hypothetical protein